MILGANTDSVTLQLERKGQPFSVSLLRVDNGLYKAIGISPVDSGRYEFKRLGFLDAWQVSFRVTANMSSAFITSSGDRFRACSFSRSMPLPSLPSRRLSGTGTPAGSTT